VLRGDGAIWVIGSYHNIYLLGALMMKEGFWILNNVVWHKTNPMPNFRGVRFTNATEELIWAKKSDKCRYVFNHATMKSMNDGKQMTNVWRIPLCGGKERLRDDSGKKLHSTQKPEEILRRVILASTRRGATVLDPFLGSGTTLAVARLLGRRGIGIEQDPGYVSIARHRIKATKEQAGLGILDEPTSQKPRRVTVAELLERGYLQAGQSLYPKNGNGPKQRTAVLLANGTLKVGDFEGSIHKAGARIENTPSCNGWMYWFFETTGGFVPLHSLREKVWRGEERR
jgi:hypothetical protein